MTTPPTSFRIDMEKPHGLAWVWFWEVVLRRATPEVPEAVLRIAAWHEDVVYPVGAGALTYSPFPFQSTELVQTNSGSLPSVELALDNTQRLALPYLLAAGSVSGNRATAYLLPQSHLGQVGAVAMSWDFVIEDVVVDNASCVFRMGAPNWLEVQTPSQRFAAQSCRWEEFAGVECGYVTNAVAALRRCDRTLRTCRLAGLDEALRGIPVLHPARFGGFPGIPVQRSYA